MTTYDLVIKGGTVVTDSIIFKGNIAIDGEKVAAWLSPSDSFEASTVINAKGMLVLPGLIDVHVHFRDPGLTHKEDFLTGTKGAAAGGVTVVLDMPNTVPPVIDGTTLRQKIEAVAPKSLVDFGLYGAASAYSLNHIDEMVKIGTIGFKTYMVLPQEKASENLYDKVSVISSTELLRVFDKVSKTSSVHAIHAEDNALVSYLSSKLKDEGRRDFVSHFDSRPNLAEEIAVYNVLGLSRLFNNKIHISHLSTKEALALIKRAKANGIDVSCETCPHYFYITKDHLISKGPYAKVNPPLRNKEDVESLRLGLRDGSIDMVASDHAPHNKEEKESGMENIWLSPPGTPGVETVLPLTMRLVDEGNLSLSKLVSLVCTNPAKRFNLYPIKGSLNPGSDADLILVKPERWKIRADILQTKSWETFMLDGEEGYGLVMLTLLRGRIVYEKDVGFGKPGKGKLLRI